MASANQDLEISTDCQRIQSEGTDGFDGAIKDVVRNSSENEENDSFGGDLVQLSEDFRNDVMNDVCQPAVGMVFSHPEEAYNFYKEYSCKVGFGVTRRSSHDFHGIRYAVTFSCHKNRSPASDGAEGFATSNRAVVGTGCRARIVVRDRLLNGRWVLEEAVIDHNHELYPDCVRLMRCHRSLPMFVKKQLEINEYAGMALNKSINTIFTQAGGITRCMFTKRDMRNYIPEFQRLQFDKGDAAALMKYFHEQQVHCPNFFYSCNIGYDGHLKSVFWADGRTRSAYSYFNDVISFDTTYLTNRYRMPLAIFVGVNHHGQSILLGCALLGNELMETYVWLFKTFLVCMSFKAPGGIITDQCGAICDALSEVFPNTRHRLCLWHIMKKLPEKLAGVKARNQIIDDCAQIVYDSESPVEFENEWRSMLSRYEFGCNFKWFCDLFEMRASWVPAFVRDSFWAGMSTTQWSESMNAFFDGYVNSRTTLKSFVEKYSLALYAKWEKEKLEDLRCSDRKVRLVSSLKIERQFAEHYTHKIFYTFQKEVKLLMSCSCCLVSIHENVQLFNVKDSSESGRSYVVQYVVDSGEYFCQCKMFQYRGIVCRHGLCVYKQVGVDSVPGKYVLNRWCRDFVQAHVMHNMSLPKVFGDVDRYNDIFKSVQQIVLELVEIGSRSRSADRLINGLLNFSREYIISESGDCNLVFHSNECNTVLSEDGVIKDPLVVNSEGRPRSRCFKSKFSKGGLKRRRTAMGRNDGCHAVDNVSQEMDPESLSATQLLLLLSSGVQ